MPVNQVIFNLASFKNRCLRKGSFTAGVLTLMTGTTLAQVIPIAVSPIITRIYTPDDFGLFALYMSIAAIIAVVATVQYETSVMLPEKEEDAINIMALSVMIAFSVSSIMFLTVWVFNKPITNLFDNPEISVWLYFIPLTVWLTGIYNTLNYWSNRNKHYNRLALNRVSQSTATAGIKLGMGFAGFGASGLVVGGIAGQSVATGALGWLVWRENKDKTNSISKDKILKNAKVYKNFPKIYTLHALLNTISHNFPILLLSSFFASSTVGFYSLSAKVALLPMSIISSSIGQVFFQKISSTYYEKKDLYPIVILLLKKLLMIAIIPFGIFALIAPELFGVVWGQDWAEAGIYSQLLIPWIFMVFLVSPLAFIPITLGRQKKALAIEFFYIIFRLISILIGAYFNSVKLSLLLFSVTGFFVLSYKMIWILHISKVGGKQ